MRESEERRNDLRWIGENQVFRTGCGAESEVKGRGENPDRGRPWLMDEEVEDKEAR